MNRGKNMNNQIPFFYPYQPYYNPQINQNDFDKILNKLEKIENELNDLEKRIIKLEKKSDFSFESDEPQDMHFI